MISSLVYRRINNALFPWFYYFVVVFGFYFYQFQREWLYLGHQVVNFGDLVWVLDRADCSLNIARLVYEDKQAEQICNTYIYGYPLLKLFNLLNIHSEHAEVVGLLFMAIFSAISAIFVAKTSKISVKILILMGLFSPPIVLLIQRANIDVMILLIVIFSVFLINRDKYLFASFAAVLVSAFKFYPFFLAIYYQLLIKELWGRILSGILIVLVCLSMIYDLSSISKIPWDARNMFGNVIWGEYFVYLKSGEGTHANYVFSSILGFILVLIPVLLIVRVGPIVNQFKFNAIHAGTKWLKNLFFVNTIIFLSCYFIGLSVDYRLVYLLIPVACLLQLCLFAWHVKSVVVTSLVVSLFASYNFGNLQVAGDFAILLLTIFLVVAMLINFKDMKILSSWIK
jgi:hypothetical protein